MPDLNSLLTSKLAFGVLIGSLVATGSTAMVAFAGALPDALQQTAHTLIGAPEPGVEPAEDALADDELDDELDDEGTDADGDGVATGPDVTGSAAFGLCTAYTKGGLAENSTAYRAFDDVEGGIDAYCDTVIRDKSENSDRWKKPDKSEKVTGPRGAGDDGAGDEGTGDEGAEAPSDAPASGGDAPAGGQGDTPAVTPEAPAPAPEAPAQSTEPAPDQQKIAPETGKPAKELPSQSNGNGGKDR